MDSRRHETLIRQTEGEKSFVQQKFPRYLPQARPSAKHGGVGTQRPEVSTSGGEVGGKKNTVNTHKTRCNEGANEDRRVGISSKKWHGFEVRADLGSKPVSSNS